MLTVAELVARLRADNSHFHRGMAQAERDLGRIEKSSTSVSRSLAQLGGRIDAIASGMAVAGATAAASLAAVGTNYNTLLQRTNAAFKVMLGNADRASKMIEELTVFARSSPFPRQIFIAGTQQLLGFGLAAEKVIPAFKAIQDAVAATGGGAAEIQQFTDVFAQIKSLGRANTETLMRFSNVGIDAFKMLAEQAGISTLEMRERITEGLMGADETIDALTKGLTEKFDGAAAGVKNTWIGTKDRIAGAWRDIGSALVAPFIDPKGGGALVDFANLIADVLRKVANEYAPLAGAKIKEFVDQFARLTEDLDADDVINKVIELWDRFGDTIEKVAPILAGLGLGLTKTGLGMIPFLGNFAAALPLPGKLAGALIGLALSSEDSREALVEVGKSLQDAFERMLPVVTPMLEKLVDRIIELVPLLIDISQIVVDTAWPVFALGLEAALQATNALLVALKPLAELLAEHPALVRILVAAWAAMKIPDFIAWASGLRAVTVAQNALNVANARGAAIAAAGVPGSIGGVTAVPTLTAIGVQAGQAGAKVGALRASLTALGKMAVPMMLVTGFLEVSNAIQETNARADEFFNETMQDVDTSSLDDMERSLTRIRDRILEIESGVLDRSGTRGAFDWVTAPGQWLAGALGFGNVNDGTDRALGQHREQERSLQRQITLTRQLAPFWNQLGGEMVDIADATGRAVVALQNGELGFLRMGNAAAQAVLNMAPIGERIAEVSTAINESMQGYMSPMAAFGAAQSAASAAARGNPVADAYRELEDAQRAAARSGQEIADAQQRVNDVLERQFDAASSASAAIDDMVAAQRASLDPVFAMIRALERRSDIKIGPQVQADDSKPLSFTNQKGNTVLDMAEANLGVNSAAIGLAGSIAAGVTSLDQVKAEINRWVEQGLMTQKEAEDLYAQVNDAVAKANSFAGDIGSQVQARVAEDRAEFDRQFSRDLQEALRGVEDAVLAAEDASRRVSEAVQGVNEARFGGFAEGVGEAKASFQDFLTFLETRIEDMRNWQANIRKIAERGGADLALEIAKWGPEAAPLVAQIATSTAPEFEKFKTLATESGKLTANGMIGELETMVELSSQLGVDTVAELERELGVMPGSISAIATHALEDFDFIMKMLALLAAEGGKSTAGNLATTLADELGLKYSEVWSSIMEYGQAFDWLGDKITDIAGKWNLWMYSASFNLGQLNQNLQQTASTNEVLGALGGLANGGIIKFAKGGWFNESHTAQIAPAGAMRLWAEPETGGEAYIPLGLAKRARSMRILSQVAGLFGMNLGPQTDSDFYASGGFGGGGGRGGNTFDIEQNIFNYGPESGSERGVRELEKMAYLNGWGD